MLRIVLALIFSTLLLSNCTSTKKPDKKPAKNPEVVVEKARPIEEPQPEEPTQLTKKDLPQGKQYTKNGDDQPSNNVLVFFSTDYWLPQFAISSLDPNAHVPFKDMWLKFKQDGTFHGGVQKTVSIKGSWKFNTQDNMLFIISNSPNLNGKWALKRSGFAMVWLARGGQKLQDIQIKLVNSSYRPWEE